MDLHYPLHLLKMKLLDLEHENEVLEASIGESWDGGKANQYCENQPKMQALQEAIAILSGDSKEHMRT